MCIIFLLESRVHGFVAVHVLQGKNEGAAMVRMRLQIERTIMNKSWQINNLMEPLCMSPGKQIIGINIDGVVMQE